MSSQNLALLWFNRHMFRRYGIRPELERMDNGICRVTFSIAGESYRIRGHSWSNLIHRIRHALREFNVGAPLAPIDLANDWLERVLTAAHGIPIYIGHDEAGLPWALVPQGGERYAIRGYSWTHLIAQVKQLLPELTSERFPLQGEPPESCC